MLSVVHNLNNLEKLYWSFSFILLTCLGLGVATDFYYVFLVPVFLLGVYITIVDFKKIFYLFFAVVPFSVELFFSNGLGTDLPTEPLALLLCGISVVLFLHRFDTIEKKYIFQGITMIILIHMSWVFFTAIFSQNITISFKYFLAKSWYVIPFYFLPFYLLKDRLDIERVMKVLLFFTTLVMIVIMVKHAAKGFTFKAINKAAHPMYRNHVIYAGLLVLLCPYIWFFYTKAKSKIGYLLLGSIYLIAIYLTYTRAAYVCVIIMIGSYFVIEYKFTKIAVLVSLILAAVAVNSLIQDNKYLDFAPEYKKTVSHMKFDNLIEATYKLEDISTMERVYRWVAGLQMVKDRPMLGFGPGCFYPFYKDYVVSSFRTYVSDNPDKSGIHNYFFMILVEQGFFGLLIILFLCVFPVLYGERIYHQLVERDDKNLVMVTILCLIAFNAMLIINDLVETDKLGSFFWINLSIMTIVGVRGKKST